MDEATIPANGHGYAILRARQRNSVGCSLPATSRMATRSDYRRRHESGFPGREGIFRLARAQKVQIARARFSEPLSRLRTVSGLPWNATARRGARGEDRGQV